MRGENINAMHCWAQLYFLGVRTQEVLKFVQVSPVMVLAGCYAESPKFSFDEQSSAPLCMISGWSGPIWLVALYDLFDEDGLLFVWIVLCLL